MIIFSLIIAVLLLAVNAADILITVKGLKAGVAVEGNPLVRELFGDKPTLKQLCLYDGIWDAALLGLLLSFSVHVGAVSGLMSGMVLAKTARHIYGYRSWYKLGVRLF